MTILKAIVPCLLFATPVQARPDRISILLGSKHIGAIYAFEETNPGIFLTWEERFLKLDYSLGIYRNSFADISVAATAAFPIFERQETQLSVFAGLALYPETGDAFAVHYGDIVPIAGIQGRHQNMFLQIMPGSDMAIVAFGITFEIN